MKCILNKNVALRSFWYIPYCYYLYEEEAPKELSEEEFKLLLLCNGKAELEESDLLKRLIFEKRLCHPTINEERELTDWQKWRVCNNHCMPTMNISITGRCNYNCLHCFNAKDNNPLNAQFAFVDLVRLFDEASKCGVHAITITGGEPMLHPQFLDIIKEIYKHHMWVFELNTNGFFITQQILDEFKNIGCKPLIKISFDGLGFHDWMRNHKGAEKIALDAIKLCIANGFKVKVQYNINKHNQSTIITTLKFLDSLGVYETRLIPTTPSPRWAQNANGNSFNTEEYFVIALDIVKNYVNLGLKMDLDIWQLIQILDNHFVYFPIMASMVEGYRENTPFCKGVRSMIAIGPNGVVYPCLQMSGILDSLGINLGNVKTDGLQKLLQDSNYMKFICQSVHDRYKFNKECQKCRYFKYCCGGCSIHGLIKQHSVLAKNEYNCYFFHNNFFDKFIALFNKGHFETIFYNPNRQK